MIRTLCVKASLEFEADEEENDVSQSPKKSMLRRVKDRAKTYIHKHGYGHSKEQGEEEDHDELEEEDGKENTEGEKKEKAEDLNSNFTSRSCMKFFNSLIL